MFYLKKKKILNELNVANLKINYQNQKIEELEKKKIIEQKRVKEYYEIIDNQNKNLNN